MKNTAQNKQIVFFAESKKNSQIEIVFRKSKKTAVFRYNLGKSAHWSFSFLMWFDFLENFIIIAEFGVENFVSFLTTP